MKFNKKQILVLLGFLTCMKMNAQQDPHYSQYMFNQSVFNPAYAGNSESLSMGVLHRQQWQGLEGAPMTSSAFINTRVGKKVGLGLSYIKDALGPLSDNNIYADLSYTVKLAPGHKLAVGIKGGYSMQTLGYFSEVFNNLKDPNDPAFATDDTNSMFKLGAGLFYYSDNYYVGLSVPNFMSDRNFSSADVKEAIDKQYIRMNSDVPHTFLTAGYVTDIAENWEIKPSTMLKYVQGAPITFDANLNTRYKKKLEFGVSYRLQDSFGAMINYAALPNLKVGYAYDYVSSELNSQTFGSHELFILFDIYFKKRVSSSPRYF